MPKEKGTFLSLVPKIVIALVIVAVLAFNAVYSINEQEQAVVTTFGTPTTVSSPGLHYKIPFLQQVTKVSTVINGFPIGYKLDTKEPIEAESLMITSDYNFVNVDFFVEYKVSDPIKFLYASQDPVLILKTLAQSYIRDTIGLYPVDSVITTGKNEIQAEIKEKLIERLEKEDLGVMLVNITIQDAEPPTTEVLEAFKAVETAKQSKETSINNANKYKSEQEPAAVAKVDEILKKAEATKQARINEAEGQVARFNAMYEEYTKNPLITKQRMFYEAMEEILPGLKIIIDDGAGGVNKLLPLEPFASGGNASPAAGSSEGGE
ncbi:MULTISPECIES: FtsH protease activity modulator HflK [Anaerotruncus]|jgi:membrane protease subunit HflK|uniref:FtsH protease activity modulator HflK n=1 Tax=Anaerotruncus TaxID=244127 RepID=UPI0008300942|nr:MULTISPECIES: FtsH protease activity modulator HflK [Anaerotruncus]RGX55996.1 FtsH protease activity modulator HflK [Anaerotruncus sp. AF02-27]